MKVCIIENIYPPYDRGGAEQVVSKTVRGLLDAGHEVVLISSSPKGDEFEEEERLRIYRKRPPNIYFYTEAHNYPPFVRLFWHAIGIFNIQIARWVDGILEKERPEAVHTHNLMGLSFLIPGVIRKRGIRHIHTVHDVQLVEPSAMILKEKEKSFRYTGMPTRLYTALMRRLVGSPDVVISPSQFLLDFYRQRGFFPASSCTVLRNPITFDLPAPERRKIPHALPSCHFLYLGQIERHKGIMFLVEAFKAFAEKEPHVSLSIAGNGSMLDEVKKITAHTPSIRVYGRVERASIHRLFEEADVTVVPSLCYENSPTVIFESFYFGVPVLASRIEGIAELIEEGENGFTFEAGNAMALQEKFLFCLQHKERLEEMSAKTTHSLLGLSLGEYIQKLVGLYELTDNG